MCRARATLACVVRLLIFMLWLAALIAVGIGAISGHHQAPQDQAPVGVGPHCCT